MQRKREDEIETTADSCTMLPRDNTWSAGAQLQYVCRWNSDQFSADLGALRRDITSELISLRHEIRIVLLALVGFMLSVVLAVTQGGIG